MGEERNKIKGSEVASQKETYETPTVSKHEKLVDITMVLLATVTVTP